MVVCFSTLFNIYSDDIFAEAVTNIQINGKYINNLGYDDDTVLLATNLADLQVITASEKYLNIRSSDTSGKK